MINTVITTLIILAPSAFADTTEVPQWAQEKKPVKVACYLGAGGSFVANDKAVNWDPKYHLFGRLDFTLSPKLSFWAGADYYFPSFKDIPGTSRKDKKLSIVNLAGDFRIGAGLPGPGINPYLFVGMGAALQSSSDSIYNIPGDTLNGSLVIIRAKGGTSIEIGGGVEYKSFFIQGRYLSILSGRKSSSFIPVTLGVKF